MKELSKKSISFQKALMGDKKVHRFHAILISSHCAITKIQIQNITQNVGMYQRIYKITMPEGFSGAPKKRVLKISENLKQNTCGEFTGSKATDFCLKRTPPRVYIFF